MSLFTAYTAAIAAQIAIKAQDPASALQGVSVLVEDANDLQTQVDKAVDEQGMVILIGMPIMDNTMQSVNVGDFKITSAISVGENPIIWRDNPLTKPVCLDVVQGIVQALQGLSVQGFARALSITRVDFIPDKKRQLYEIAIESRVIVGAQP